MNITNNNSKSSMIRRIMDIQADLLNEKFKKLFFSNIEPGEDGEVEQIEIEKIRIIKKRIKMIHLPNLKLAV